MVSVVAILISQSSLFLFTWFGYEKKQLSPKLNNVISEVTATVNYVKTRLVKARIFRDCAK